MAKAPEVKLPEPTVELSELMAKYDARRLHGWPAQSASDYIINGSMVYIATLEGHSGRPILDVKSIDSLVKLYG